MSKALEIIELLEYIVESSVNSKKPLPHKHLQRVIAELKEIIISNKSLNAGEDYHSDDNYVSDMYEEVLESDMEGEDSFSRFSARSSSSGSLSRRDMNRGRASAQGVSSQGVSSQGVSSQGVSSLGVSQSQMTERGSATSSKKNGLASRIKPVPAEVRGRVRELVDLISDDHQFEETLENSQQ